MRLIIALFLIGYQQATAQQITISGYAVDAGTGETLAGVVVRQGNTTNAVVTNRYGFFSIQVASPAILQGSYIGYEVREIAVGSRRDTVATLLLFEKVAELETVTIRADRETTLNEPLGMISIPVSQLKRVPALFGETDILKALALTPGVSTGNEGTTGLLVRGGGADQNLILLDNATVYNTAHLFGFVSAFNPDAIKRVDLYKGSFPARYGGRLSSVVDIALKEGNANHTVKEISVGLISSRLLLEGPIKRNNSSYMVAGRSSYFSLFTLPLLISQQISRSGPYANYWLYDITAKANWKLSNGRHLYTSLYRSHDSWVATERTGDDRTAFRLNWGNTIVATRYTHSLTPRVFWESIATYTNYQYGMETETEVREKKRWQTQQQIAVRSDIQDFTAKTSLDWFVKPGLKVQTGIEAIRHRFRPTQVQTTYAIPPDTVAAINRPVFSTEIAAYTEVEKQWWHTIKAIAGVRVVRYGVQQRAYPSVEPRLSVQALVLPTLTLKADYSQMRQFIHLLSSNSVGLPNDLWVPATASVPPQTARQLSAGISCRPANKLLTVSLEVYKKWSSGLIDYPTGTNFLTGFTRSWESVVVRDGIGRSSGLEVLIQKNTGSLTGWLSYTLARHERRFAAIDNGAWYAAPFDRRHVFAVTGQYPVSNRVRLAATWQFQTGQPTTLPVAQYPNFTGERTAVPLFIYAERNNFRMPAYHRLDVGLTVARTTRKKRTAEWAVGVYNAYNRANPFYLDFKQRSTYNLATLTVTGFSSELVRQGVFPVLPYLSYHLSY